MTIWRMRIACWITKARDAHSEYVILIAFTGIFGPVQNEDGSWRIGTNYELNKLIENAD